MRRTGRARAAVLAAAAVACASSWGCDQGVAEAGPAAGGYVLVGAACGARAACAPPLLCVDGRCRPRGWAWAADTDTVADTAPLTDAAAGADTAPDAVPDAVADTVPDAVADTAPDTVPDAVADADTAPLPDAAAVADTEMVADTAPDTVPDADTVADTVADTAPDDAPPATATLLLVEDEADLGVGEGSVALALGQGWVTTLHVPPDATVLGAQALAGDSFAGESCGLFSLAVWAPGAPGEQGGAGPSWPTEPTWVSSAALPLQGLAPPQLLLLPDPEQVPIPEGLLRVGLLYAAPCEGGPPPPLLLTDTSGQLGVGFLYDPATGGASPWVTDAFLGLQGRWALRLLVSVPAP